MPHVVAGTAPCQTRASLMPLHRGFQGVFFMVSLKRLTCAVLGCAILFTAQASLAEARLHRVLATLTPEKSDFDNLGVTDNQADFGKAVAIQGSTALVGMPKSSFTPGNVLETGRVGVFTYSSGKWIRTATLRPSDPTSELHFGQAIALQDDTALIGSNKGLYVFRRASGSWRQIQKLGVPSSDGVTVFPEQ